MQHCHKKQVFFSIIMMILSGIASIGTVFAQSAASDSLRLKLLDTAIRYLGTPYRYSGTTEKGMDCSGFVYRSVLDSLELKLPHQAAALAKQVQHIADTDIQPGDLLFFQEGAKISHTGIYLGAGQFIHAASDGPATGVIISKIQDSYWKKTYRFSGRLLKTEPIFLTEAKDTALLDRTSENSPLYPDIADTIQEKNGAKK